MFLLTFRKFISPFYIHFLALRTVFRPTLCISAYFVWHGFGLARHAAQTPSSMKVGHPTSDVYDMIATDPDLSKETDRLFARTPKMSSDARSLRPLADAEASEYYDRLRQVSRRRKTRACMWWEFCCRGFGTPTPWRSFCSGCLSRPYGRMRTCMPFQVGDLQAAEGLAK
jgi:hypothetical protein